MRRIVLFLMTVLMLSCHSAAAEKAKIVFLSGTPSHGRMSHEHRAGNMILAEALERSGLAVDPYVVPHYGYPKDKKVLADAATVVIFCTGHRGHILRPHLDEFDALMKQGTGVVMIHWATEAEKGKPGQKFLEWMGGFCDLDWSVNPHWTAHFKDFPNHPICNGVKPFNVNDEWYYHMRFVEDQKGLTPILFDLPPAETLRRKDGPRSGNPTVRKAVAAGQQQTVAWSYQRPSGGRGFGFTGAHNHASWRSDGFRKIVLNAILWTAHVDVPADGCPSETPSKKAIEENLDPTRKAAKTQSAVEKLRVLQRVAAGFKIEDVGQRGVIYHKAYRSRTAVETHPIDRTTPFVIHRVVDVPQDKKTLLQLRVSHHPEGDWQLRVLADKRVLADRLVSAKTVPQNQWLEVQVDLTEFAGSQLKLSLENRANDWFCEWAYWNQIKIVSQ